MRTVQIRLSNGEVATVDQEDAEMVAQFGWHSLRGYAVTTGGKKFQSMHRLIAAPPDGVDIDHRDCNRLNNTRQNLRVCSDSQNNHNKHKGPNTTSRYKGVTWHKRLSKWQAQIKVDGKNHYLGVFRSEFCAAEAYLIGAQIMYGEYARVA